MSNSYFIRRPNEVHTMVMEAEGGGGGDKRLGSEPSSTGLRGRCGHGPNHLDSSPLHLELGAYFLLIENPASSSYVGPTFFGRERDSEKGKFQSVKVKQETSTHNITAVFLVYILLF